MRKVEEQLIVLISNYKTKEALELLKVAKKININYQDRIGNTILMKCTNYTSHKDPQSSLELLNLIIAHGADVNIRNIHKRSPIDNLLDDGHIEGIKRLIEVGGELITNDPNIYKNQFNSCYYLMKKINNFDKLFEIFKQEINTEEKFNVFKEMFNTCMTCNYSFTFLIDQRIKNELESYISTQNNYYQLQKNLGNPDYNKELKTKKI